MTKHTNHIASERSIRYNRRNNLKIRPVIKAISINKEKRQALEKGQSVSWITWIRNESDLKYIKKIEKTNELNQVFKYAL